jgi:diguanylate cyclase (GGDEF)-like protein
VSRSLRDVLPGRVTRRVVLLFILSAFVPLGVMAGLSLSQVRDLLLQESEQRLAARSKEYGYELLERLMLASEAASGAVARRDRAWHAPSSLSRYFHSLGILDARGKTTSVIGAPVFPQVSPELRRRLDAGRHAIAFAPGTPARVFLLVPDFDIAHGALLFGELEPDFLWGHPDLFPAATEYSVIDEDTRLMLFSTSPVSDGMRKAIDTASQQSTLRSVAWKQDGETRRAVAWGQFMRAEFGIGEWIVVASQPESYQLRRVGEFRELFIQVTLLALLIVAWLSVRQIRRTLVPVEELAEGARRVARNDFSTRIAVRRNDEFGELATAFNHMSAKVGRQFSTLTALAEIDHLILSNTDTDKIIGTVLERLDDLVRADCSSVTLFDRDNPGLGRTYARAALAPGEFSVIRHEISPRERGKLEALPRGFWSPSTEPAPSYLSQQRSRGLAACYVQPILWRETVCGALALGFPSTADLTDDDRKQISEFADRVAVAISSAWRDEQLHLQAHFDALTGLPNRSLLKDRLAQQITRCQRETGSFALLFIDLDNFKDVNDTLGHASGDAVLREAARRISRCLRESDTVSRLGGDEFNVILTQVQHPRDAARVADNIIKSLSDAIVIEHQASFLSASVGIAIYPQDGKSAEELIRNADTAMYRAKSAGRAQAVYFEEKMNAEAVARVTLDRELRRAIDRGELRLVYQPLLALPGRRVRGAEALLRWQHPTLGAMPPNQFIRLAEDSGYIEQLGQWVLHEACRQMRRWQAEGVAPERLAINVSARQFRKLDLVELIVECTRAAGISPSRLELEITETALIDRGAAVEGMLRELGTMGASISLDDFGTGFSSMAYLKRFPVDVIKIDRVFIESLGSDSGSEVIVAAVIAMSHALGKTVVAEGVETEEQYRLLCKLKCDRAQGFLFCPPLPVDQFSQFMRAHETRATPSVPRPSDDTHLGAQRE